ncbi:MAG: hypothetical protein JWM28_1606, partial [Chitinophagaceae bacterium]|nr:hypothetical protein [Chitinophagaceae bacterium]
MYRKINPSIVLINFQLEDMTGLECLRRIMSIQKKKIAPVYIYHRLITPHLVTRALHNGARGCLTFNHEGKDLTNFLTEIMK